MNFGLSPIPVMLKSPLWGVGGLSFWGGRDCSLKPAGNFAAFFCYHPHFQYHAIFLAATPHTLKRQTAAISGKKRRYYTAHSGHGAMITHRTPVSCVTMCNGVQGVGKNMPFTVQKCAVNLSDMKKIIYFTPDKADANRIILPV
jgi:hypothetical protein